MPGLDKEILALKNVVVEIERSISGKAAQILGNDIVALITTRVVQTGKDEKGQFFTPYSTRPMQARKLKGKSRTTKAERAVTALAQKGGSISYSDFRKLNNLETNFKNFEFTGEMFRQFGVTEFSGADGDFMVVLDGKTGESQRKLKRLFKLEGKSVVLASDQEINLLDRLLTNYIDDLLQKAFT